MSLIREWEGWWGSGGLGMLCGVEIDGIDNTREIGHIHMMYGRERRPILRKWKAGWGSWQYGQLEERYQVKSKVERPPMGSFITAFTMGEKQSQDFLQSLRFRLSALLHLATLYMLSTRLSSRPATHNTQFITPALPRLKTSSFNDLDHYSDTNAWYQRSPHVPKLNMPASANSPTSHISKPSIPSTRREFNLHGLKVCTSS